MFMASEKEIVMLSKEATDYLHRIFNKSAAGLGEINWRKIFQADGTIRKEAEIAISFSYLQIQKIRGFIKTHLGYGWSNDHLQICTFFDECAYLAAVRILQLSKSTNISEF